VEVADAFERRAVVGKVRLREVDSEIPTPSASSSTSSCSSVVGAAAAPCSAAACAASVIRKS